VEGNWKSRIVWEESSGRKQAQKGRKNSVLYAFWNRVIRLPNSFNFLRFFAPFCG